jgi:hypothetical protein
VDNLIVTVVIEAEKPPYFCQISSLQLTPATASLSSHLQRPRALRCPHLSASNSGESTSGKQAWLQGGWDRGKCVCVCVCEREREKERERERERERDRERKRKREREREYEYLSSWVKEGEMETQAKGKNKAPRPEPGQREMGKRKAKEG